MNKYIAFNTSSEIAHQLAQWVVMHRLELNLTQQQVANQANIAAGTYKKFEQTGEVSLVRFIAIMRAIDQLDALENILKLKSETGPMAKLMGKRPKARKRARRKK